LRVVPFGKFDYSSAMPVERGDIDHCFVGWDRRAEIEWPDRRYALEITASDTLPCAVVCIRSDIGCFCFEPVPHINDALNRRDRDFAMPVIAPGRSFTARILFRAVKRRGS
jgi:aldose 1-epimerase